MDQKEFRPYISTTQNIAEFTIMPLVMGMVLGVVFGASSLYLALRVGMTVSASIPIAVLSITLFRAFSKLTGTKGATILQNNIVQTTGSAGESIAFGVACTMPAIMILGYDMDVTRVMLVSILGGLLGVLMMIPLRWSMIVKEHGKLVYPEGTACAEVLMVGEKGGMSATTVFVGFGIGLLYKVLNVVCHLWKDAPEHIFKTYRNASFSTEVSPELMGVGYVIGFRAGCLMLAGGVMSALVLIPAITLFGADVATPIFPGTKPIAQMSVHEIWRNYVLYIGAGAVATAGIMSLLQNLPTIVRSAAAGLAGLRGRNSKAEVKRTERDISLKYVFLGCAFLVAALWLSPTLKLNLLGALLVVVFGFLFVTVSSRITGEIGSSSNPISGMTVATLILTCLIFVLVGWVGADYRVTALSVAGVVCIAASNGGTTSQDLKTGYIVGATPRWQQVGLLFGAVSSAVVIGYTLLYLNQASTIYHRVKHAGFKVDVSSLTERQPLQGPEAKTDTKTYLVYHMTEPKGGVAAGKYFVSDAGELMYLVDPGINGALKYRDADVDKANAVQKYEAPKARLMALIIDGMLTQKLPWALVLIGAFIAITLQLCGVSALAFATGVYLPIAASAPIFFGGLVRYIVEATSKKKKAEDSDSSPGILFSSGLIAGGSIAGICIALLATRDDILGSMNLSSLVGSLAESDTFAYVAFAGLATVLFLVAKGKWLTERSR